MLGEVVGNFRIVSRISGGGMGTVYRAEHVLLGKPAAVKVLLPELSSKPEVVTRFFNEAKAMTQVRHPGIVEMFDFGHHSSGRAYIVMELLGGEPLSMRLRRCQRIPEATAVTWTRAIAGALGAAHAAGVIHRDLKPDNVFLVPDGEVVGGERPKILDFGIAKLSEAHGGNNLTRTDMVLGTPTYMAPEQCRGAGLIDARSDLYSLGCLLYEMLCGRPPFVGEGMGDVLAAHMFFAPEPPRVHAPELSPAIERLIMCLLAKAPDQRFPSARHLIAALDGLRGAPSSLVDSAREPHGAAADGVPASITTLGGATGQSSPSMLLGGGGRRRWTATLVSAAAAAAIFLALVLWRSGGGGDPDAGPPIARPAAAPVSAAPVPAAPAPAPTPAPVEAAPAPAVVEAAQPTVTTPSPEETAAAERAAAEQAAAEQAAAEKAAAEKLAAEKLAAEKLAAEKAAEKAAAERRRRRGRRDKPVDSDSTLAPTEPSAPTLPVESDV